MTPSLFDLTGRVAIVTGGNQGIGLAMAEALASAGAHLIIANRREEEGKKAAEEIQQRFGVKARAIGTDVSDASSVESMVKEAKATLGQIDILVNNAGVILRKRIEETEEKDWDWLMGINLKGYFLCCRAVIPLMKAQGKGKIINVSSTSSLIGMRERVAYCSSKGGVSQLTRALAIELAKDNIQVNAIAPGFIRTPLNDQYFQENPSHYERFVAHIPMGRVGRPEELAGITIYLASDASSYTTGQILVVDGGWTTW
ncbi:MAG: glucose 1-dehydrogenase [candidate division NC10 bacterium]|nr:glucose 1-dehydrogenase [candidate division NC10 bacterium]